MTTDGLLLGIAMAAAAGLVGCFAVMRRMTLAGDALSHIALPGIGVALALHVHPVFGAAAMLFFGALLVWWSVIEPKRRRTPGELWKVPYLIGARVGGMFLGMALILLRSPAYAAYYGDRPREHGLSPITDQQIAGGMMMGLDLFVMLFALAFFFYRSAEEHDRAERATVAAG